jgi:mono/diheme cytochrome c family protein
MPLDGGRAGDYEIGRWYNEPSAVAIIGRTMRWWIERTGSDVRHSYAEAPMGGRRRLFLALCCAFVASAALPLLGLAQTAADSTTPAAISAGRDIYHSAGTCQVCHGANLEGGVGPTLKAHPWKDAKGGGYEAIFDVVTKGVSGTAMVSHPGGISDDDARKVAAYVWAVSHGKANP